jgi:hypothetical protein
LNSLSSQSTILSQVQGSIDYYASQSSTIQSTIAASFSDYKNAPIDATTIKNSIQITQPTTTTTTISSTTTTTTATLPFVGYTASLTNVLVMQSTTQINPNTVFGSLTNLVKYNFLFRKFNILIYANIFTNYKIGDWILCHSKADSYAYSWTR